MTRRSFFRNFGGIIASVAIAQKVVVDITLESMQGLRSIEYLIKVPEFMLPVTPFWYWHNDVLNEDGTFKKNLGNTIRHVV